MNEFTIRLRIRESHWKNDGKFTVSQNLCATKFDLFFGSDRQNVFSERFLFFLVVRHFVEARRQKKKHAAKTHRQTQRDFLFRKRLTSLFFSRCGSKTVDLSSLRLI